MISDLECKQCVLLGVMGMARTIQLVKYIASHEGLQRMSYFDTFIQGGMRKALYNDLEVNKKIKKGVRICNSLIPILENEHESDIINEQDYFLMNLDYSLVENWYYFINDLSCDMNDEKCKLLIKYLTVPGETIHAYLRIIYEVKYHMQSIDKDRKAEEHHIFKKELDIIDDDLKFVKKNNNSSDLEQRVNGYMQYRFWEQNGVW